MPIRDATCWNFHSLSEIKLATRLYQAQLGGKHLDAKPLKGFGSGVLEVVSDHRGDAYRAVYTVRLKRAVYVLHAFQKKSKRGIATPQAEFEVVRARLKRAIQIDEQEEK